MLHRLPLVLAAVLLSLWVAGCSEKPAEPTEETLNLDADFGGYTASPEAPGFGDADLVEEAVSDSEFNDEVLGFERVNSVIADPQCGYYHFRAVWGRLHYDSTVTELTDWTGSLSVSRGVEIIRRVIRFEPEQDYIVRPRTDPSVIEWVSRTSVHHDGIAVDIFVPRPRLVIDTVQVPQVDSLGDTSYVIVIDTVLGDTSPVTVSFETGPYSRTFAVDELRSLDTVVYLDDSNAVAFHAVEFNRYPCPRGFLAGNWGFDEEGRGRFRGVWWSRGLPSRWEISGYVQGHFGQNSAGRDVFFGKWISRSGRFEGFLKGTYGRIPGPEMADDNARKHARGWFAGRVFNADRLPIGALKGRFRSASAEPDGFFQGRWKLFCPAVEPEAAENEDGF
ncbi:MAG TPA: hypothetical protein VN285_07075 [Candidatus Deferrimicrobium sp.]|nr:hypothetical protein [Candidatus Deferrimicrobium sp.]